MLFQDVLVIVRQVEFSIAELLLWGAELMFCIAELSLPMAELLLRGEERCLFTADAKFRCDCGRLSLRSERCPN